MNKKLITVVLLLTIIPVVLLVWLAIFGYRSEEDRNLRQIQSLGLERLKTVDLQIEGYFQNLEQTLLTLPEFYATVKNTARETEHRKVFQQNVDALRELTRKSSLIRQIFILDADNYFIFPSETIPLSKQERDFLLRTKEIDLGPALFIQSERRLESENEMEGTAGEFAANHGWYTWYLGEGINFIFWRRFHGNDTEQANPFITGVELNRMAVISEIIRNLPATDLEDNDTFQVLLKDVKDEIVYIWGSYTPADDVPATASIQVAPPLRSWRLEYYLPPGTEEVAFGRIIPIFGSIGFIILVIIGISIYFYRESTREIREAYKRVSFVNQVSHELKTPLTNIRMYAELLENKLPENDKRAADYLGIVTSESNRLSRLIGNVLTFAKEQRKGIQCSLSEAIPDSIINSTVEKFRPSLLNKHFTIDLDLKADTPVFLDREIVEQIVNNLISNVEKYAFSGTYLGITTYQEDKYTIIIVKDRGPGIPKKLREKVFTPFFRVSNKSTDGITGTGIGLSIVRALATSHSGTVEVLETEEGAGIRVVLTTPMQSDDGDTDENIISGR